MPDQVFLTEQETASRIRQLFQQADLIKCAVAFWGDKAPDMLGLRQGLNKTALIICNFESGATNPKVMKELWQIKGVAVRSHPRLHAKVYWTEKGAIVGSSNASANGLSFEGTEIEGWLEANILVTDREVLRQINTWFDQLWQQAQPLNDARIKAADQKWFTRRDHRPFPDISHVPNRSLLTALKKNRNSFKERNIVIAIYRHDISTEARKVMAKWAEQQGLPLPDVGGFENWTAISANMTAIQLYYGPRGGFDYTGLSYIPEPKLDIPLKYSNGEKGVLTVAFIREDFRGLTLTREDISLFKSKIVQLFNSRQAKRDGGSVILPLYDAWPILFG